MTPEAFRRLALSFPEAVENSHMHHPDFRVRGKIFATLGYPDQGWGTVMLSPEQQQEFVRAAPKVFVPAKGAWGRNGSTCVNLRAVTKELLRPALEAAALRASLKGLKPSARRRKAPRASPQRELLFESESPLAHKFRRALLDAPFVSAFHRFPILAVV